MDTYIRAWKIEDAQDLALSLSNKNIQDNLRDGLPYPYTTLDAQQFIESQLNAEKDSQYPFAIVCDDKVIGSIGVFRQGNIHRLTGEMGYYISEDFWNKGIATMAVKAICKYVFENTDIIRIFAEPFSDNQASCKVLEKAGFKFEGTLRSNAIKNNKILDMNMYALVKD
jgi:[ribosomal protein S5]-alanine N-acetyltransferase